MPTSFIAQDIMAEHLLSHNAIVFLKDKPMRLRSGLVTPIYVDNRILPSYPEAWIRPGHGQLSAVCLLNLLKTNQFLLTENGRPRNLPFFMCERLIPRGTGTS